MAHPSPALSDWTASSASPMLPEKHNNYPHTVYTSIPNAQHEYAPYDTSTQHLLSLDAANARLARVKRIQRYNNTFGYILAIFSATNTALMEAAMVYVLYKFYTTKDIPAPGRTSPWAQGTQLWPTFLLLAASFLTLVMDLGGFIAFLCCRSRRGEKVEASFNYTGYAIFVAKWVAVLILYRIGKTSKDLWGWSCSDRADQIQHFYATDLNFKQLCVEQTVAWGLTFAEVALKIILLITALLLARKVKKLNRTR